VTTPAAWDAQAADFDAEPDHGLTDPAVRAAWRELLTPLLPPTPPTRDAIRAAMVHAGLINA